MKDNETKAPDAPVVRAPYNLMRDAFSLMQSEPFYARIFAKIDNLLDEEFETFGLLGEEPGETQVPVIEEMTIPIFLGAAPPRAGFAGIRYRF